MKIISTQAEFARLTGLTRQAISEAIKEGLIPFETVGKKKLIDLNNPAVKEYIKSQTRQREAAKKKTTKNPSEKQVEKTAKSKTASGKQAKKQSEYKIQSEVRTDYSHLSMNELHTELKIADLTKKQIEIDAKNKTLIPTDFIKNHLFKYIEKLNSSMERSASVFINEIGQQILAEGEVTPAHIDKFVTLVLQACDDTKQNIIKSIKKYEPR